MKSYEDCRDHTERRRLIRAHTNEEGASDLNGIDYLEVNESQHILTLFFLGKAPTEIRKRNVVIEGGARIRDIEVVKIRLCRIDDPERDDCLKVFVDKPGDFSTYTLKLVNAYGGRPSDEPFDGFDPRYAQIDFSFKANCPTDLDCRTETLCAPEPRPEPEINYLAKDYASFRQLILDRLALIMPDWRERHVPDIGIALVELLAYTGDYLSYYQDAVATESYLDTARQRISVHRHAMLVDYRMHEGCNSRAWVSVEVNTDLKGISPEDIYFITRVNSLLPSLDSAQASSSSGRSLIDKEELRDIRPELYEAFEPLVQDARQPLDLYQAHNELHFYTWRDSECCLPRGATQATLDDDPRAEDEEEETPVPPPGYGDEDDDYPQQASWKAAGTQRQHQPAYQKPPEQDEDDYPEEEEEEKPVRRLHLRAGDVLIFEEVLGPNTGKPQDADRAHRHAVRLTGVRPDLDPLTNRLVLNIEWSEEDALPFALCISAIGRAPECELIKNVSVVRGNVILCDHGRTVWSKEWLVPAAAEEDTGCFAVGEPRETVLRPGYFRPRLDSAPLTHGVPLAQSSVISRLQAKALSGMMAAVRSLVVERLKQTRRDDPLSEEQLSELKIIYGERQLSEIGLAWPSKKEQYVMSAQEQADALERLLSLQERFLEKKRRRLEVLRRRALAGYVLTDLERGELTKMFGDGLVLSLGLTGDSMLGSASAALRQNPRDAMPRLVVYDAPPSAPNGSQQSEADDEEAAVPREVWTPVSNLLSSRARDRHFVAEVDDEGFAHLRFGNGELGHAVAAHHRLQAKYRTGQGRSGNVGAEAIAHLVFRDKKTGTASDVRRVRNPLPARGGTAPETLEEVKLFAPTAFRKIRQRAITAEDYSSLAESGNATTVQQAAANLRWTGSWYEMQMAVDPLGALEGDERLFEEVRDSLAPFRRMGHDLSVRGAQYVPLDIELVVCVLPGYLRGHVQAALSDLFSNRRLPDGRLGLFHPDNLTFGDHIYLSKLVAAAQGVPGVETARVSKLQRLYEGRNGEIENGVLPLGALEVARLDNDPSFPERGKLQLTMRGGR